MQSKLDIWILASRPKTLWAGVSPVVIGTAMAYSDEKAHLIAALCTLIGAILIQIGTNFANDYYDYVKGADSSERTGPVRVTQAGLVNPDTMKKAFIITFTLAVISGIYLIWRGGLPILAVGLLSILFGVLYTGGPFPLGYNGLGELFVLIFFGFVAVGGTYYVQALEINSTVILAGLAPGLFSSAILTVNNLRDIKTDRESGKKTLAVRFGKNFARVEYLLTVVAACVTPLLLVLYTGGHYFSLFSLSILIIAIPAIRTVFSDADGKTLNDILAKTGKLLLFYSLFFSAGWNV
jgi:1,4-dihydroxy-2-naphthoate octaprenyltransferase